MQRWLDGRLLVVLLQRTLHRPQPPCQPKLSISKEPGVLDRVGGFSEGFAGQARGMERGKGMLLRTALPNMGHKVRRLPAGDIGGV